MYFDFRKTFNAAMTDKGLDGVANQECAAKVLKEHDTMENLWNSFIHNKYSAIKQPAIDASDFELKPALIIMVQQNQFAGHSTENPNEHLGRFLRIANSINLSGVKPEVIQLQLFPFSLRDMAITWFNSLPHESVNTWEELMRLISTNSLPHPSILNKDWKRLIPNMGEMRIGILLGGILLNTTLDHPDLQREMAELKRAK